MSCVMAAAVKLHAAGGNLLHVKIGVDDRFLVPDSFAGIMAEGVDDAAAAAAGLPVAASIFC